MKKSTLILEQKLGFSEIKAYLNKFCASELGREKVQNVRFSTNQQDIEKWLAQTAEMQFVLLQSALPNDHFYNLTNALQKAKIDEAVLDSASLREIADLLFLADMIKRRFMEYQETPLLQKLVKYIALPKPLMKAIDEKIDEKAIVRDNASPTLRTLRIERHQAELKLRKDMDRYLKMAVANGFAEKGANLSIREGRMVIPMLAEHKRKIKGLVHDESATGHLVYLEPSEVLEVHNRIRSIGYEEAREIRRILKDLTSLVGPYAKDIEKWQHCLATVDFIRAKARLANKYSGIAPLFNPENNVLDWKNAKHPLLLFSHQALDKSVVPLNVHLTDTNRIIILSGPNAGGKSVTLKTLGLLQYMIQSGIPVPMEEGSRAKIFDQIFIDIGDQQSIQDDLSTYSSHLSNMKRVLQMTTAQSMVLFDEFGTGTDPAYGGAIAEAILEELVEKKVSGLINTHYSNLKDFANKQEFVVNARLLFDSENLQPLYQLQIGEPGSSYALEIAQKIGLSRGVIKKASAKIGIEKVRYDKLLATLDQEKQAFEKSNHELKVKITALEKDQRFYKTLNKELSLQRKQLLNKAKIEAKQVVESANKKIEKVIKEIREKKAEKEATQLIRKKLQRYKEQALKLQPLEEQKQSSVERSNMGKKDQHDAIQAASVLDESTKTIVAGDRVQIEGSGPEGRVLQVQGKNAEVAFGLIKINIALKKLTRLGASNAAKAKDTGFSKQSKQSVGKTMYQKSLDFTPFLDMRGMKAEEAIQTVENFIDEATIAGGKDIKILHGKGNGVLRNIVRKVLREYNHVKNVRDAHIDHGGAGITVFDME